MTDTTTRSKFEHVYINIVDELAAQLARENLPGDALEWYRKNIDYNVPHGELYRGMSVIDTVEILKRRSLSDEEYYKAAVLGWCIELSKAYFLVADDIMDASITRSGQPCWYRNPDVGMIAVNDAVMLKSTVYHILKTYFKREPYYVDLLELFLEMTFNTEIGQLLDLTLSPEQVDLSQFSLERCNLIATYKTAFFSAYLPVACAMYMCGIPQTPMPGLNLKEPANDPYDVAKSILIPLGEYFQAYDDYADYAASPEQTGKIGTDIIDNKCSWCVGTALLHATPSQRKVLDEHYGVKPSGGESELKVKVVFDEIGLHEKFAAYEESIVTLVRGRINEFTELEGENVLRKAVFEKFIAGFANTYTRSKWITVV